MLSLLFEEDNGDQNTENHQEQDDQTNTLNESITDIIQTLKLSEKSNNEKSLNDSNNMYSFSSKPIVVDVDNRKAKNPMEVSRLECVVFVAFAKLDHLLSSQRFMISASMHRIRHKKNQSV